MDLGQVESAYMELYRSGQYYSDPHVSEAEADDVESDRTQPVTVDRKVAFVLGDSLLSAALRSVEKGHPMLGGIRDHDLVFVRRHEVGSLAVHGRRISLAVVEAIGTTNVIGTVSCLRCIDDTIPVVLVVADEEKLSEPVAHLVRTGAVRAVVCAGISADLWSGVLQLVLNGGTYLPPTYPTPDQPAAEMYPVIDGARDGAGTGAGAPHASQPGESAATDEILTERERQILALLSEGHQNKIIASDLSLSEHTVKVHLQNLYRKLGVHNRTQAVAVGRRLNATTVN